MYANLRSTESGQLGVSWHNVANMRSKTVDGSKLRGAREDAELTLDELAVKVSEEIGRRVHGASLAHLELGTRQPSARMWGAITRALQIDGSTLLVSGEEAA